MGRPARRQHARLSLPPHREFIEKRYVELKKANPGLPILIRECSDVQPKLWARYGKPGKRAIWEPGRRIGVGEDEGPSRVTEKPVGRLELGT